MGQLADAPRDTVNPMRPSASRAKPDWQAKDSAALAAGQAGRCLSGCISTHRAPTLGRGTQKRAGGWIVQHER